MFYSIFKNFIRIKIISTKVEKKLKKKNVDFRFLFYNLEWLDIRYIFYIIPYLENTNILYNKIKYNIFVEKFKFQFFNIILPF